MQSLLQNSFLTKLIDWKGFELFVSDLYKDSDEVTVQHNVTEIGKSGAKRQIDVLVFQQTKLHNLKILVECKFWKNKVDRHVIDVLAASIEDLNASKGVIFTTKGYEEGAIHYAKSKNIDIFIVRDVIENEWGHPGRNILLYLQTFNGKIHSINIENGKFISLTGKILTSNKLSFEIYLSKDMEQNKKFTLYSFPDLEQGPNLVKLIADIRNDILKRWVNHFNFKLEPEDQECEIAYETPVKVNFTDYKFRYLKVDDGFVTFDYLNFLFLQSVLQTKMYFDRANSMDFVLIVENYITNQRNFVSKPKEESSIKLSNPIEDAKVAEEEKFVNGSIFKVMMDYYIDLVLRPSTIINYTKTMTINLQEKSK